MERKHNLSKDGIKYIIRVGFQFVLQLAVIFATAGTFSVGKQIIIYFVALSASYTISLLVILRHNPEVLNERVRNINVNTKPWDRVLLSLYMIFTFVIMYIFSVIINTKSLIENKFFESSSRIQIDRNQTVISTGVYSVVRHPGYSSIVVWALSIPLLTGAIYTLIPSIAIITIITVRTYMEDNEYSDKQ